MKSIIHEASSIGKAIEQGWHKAGCPKEFSVRILEEPERNFIGLTVKTAKVALFFGEKTVAPTPTLVTPQRPRRESSAPRQQIFSTPSASQSRSGRPQRSSYEQRSERIERNQDHHEQPFSEQREQHSFWTEEYASFARDWIEGALTALGKPNLSFVIETKGYHLHIYLNEQIYDDSAREKHLFANCAFLLGEALKRHFRTSLRGHKIVLTHGRTA